MIHENDLVVILIDLTGAKLVRGDIGTIAMVHGNQQAFEVEFVNAAGKTIAVETLCRDQVRKIDQEMAVLHVPELQLAA